MNYIKFYQCFPDEQIVNACVHNHLPTKEQLKAEIERKGKQRRLSALVLRFSGFLQKGFIV